MRLGLLVGLVFMGVGGASAQALLEDDILWVAQRQINEMQAAETLPAGDLRVLGVATAKGYIAVDFSAAFGGLTTREREHFFHELMPQIEQLFASSPSHLQYDFTVAGQSWGALLQQQDQAAIAALPNLSVPPSQTRSAGTLSERKVAISAGHGWTYYSSCNCYRRQRAFFWGIVEDDINAVIINELYDRLTAEGATVYVTRNRDDQAGDGVTGYPRWQENARQYFRSLGLSSSIWDTGTDAWGSDLRSRPLYANAVDADILINLHNNGGCGNTCEGRGGTYTLYDSANGYQNRSRALADAVHNAIISQIHDNYNPSWYGARGIRGSNGAYGENRIATRPAILIEAAFMDEKTPDNDALRDPVFRSILVEGIYDGIVAYYELPMNAIARVDADLVENGDFSLGADGWDLSDSDTDSDVDEGVLHWRAQLRSPGSTVYGVVQQRMPYIVPVGSVLDLQFDLGNTSGVDKTVTVNLGDTFLRHSNQGAVYDLGVRCTFQLPAETSLQTYRMQVPVTTSWSQATLLLEARPPDGVPDVQLDNVSLHRRSELTARSPMCGPSSADVVADGRITPADVVYVVNRIDRTDGDALLADVSGDGEVTQLDAELVVERLGSVVD